VVSISLPLHSEEEELSENATFNAWIDITQIFIADFVVNEVNIGYEKHERSTCFRLGADQQ
jgi:hypothetical protein